MEEYNIVDKFSKDCEMDGWLGNGGGHSIMSSRNISKSLIVKDLSFEVMPFVQFFRLIHSYLTVFSTEMAVCLR